MKRTVTLLTIVAAMLAVPVGTGSAAAPTSQVAITAHNGGHTTDLARVKGTINVTYSVEDSIRQAFSSRGILLVPRHNYIAWAWNSSESRSDGGYRLSITDGMVFPVVSKTTGTVTIYATLDGHVVGKVALKVVPKV
jgi:hypothetical protein